MLFYNKENKFNFKRTQGLNVIEYGLYSLDKDEPNGSNTGLSVKMSYKREDFINLKQHIDAILEQQQKTPDNWRNYAAEQLPYLKGNPDELIHPDLASELQRSSDFLGMLIASNLPNFYY